VGYDNTTIASIAPIDLTSVDRAGHDMRVTAARLLRERMDGRSRSVLTSAAPRLIIRNTTGPPAPSRRDPRDVPQRPSQTTS
jgi:LacI family transcriptional regulator